MQLGLLPTLSWFPKSYDRKLFFNIDGIRLVRTVDPSWNGKWRTVPLPSKCLDLSRVRVYISGATLHYNKPYIRRRRLIARPFLLVSPSVDK